MAKFQCGDKLRCEIASSIPGTSTCLLRFKEHPERLLMMTAGHVVLTKSARQGDPIYIADGSDPPQMLGRLHTWTMIDGDPTVDAALIWVYPDKVDAKMRVGSTLSMLQPPGTPTVGQRIQTSAHPLLRDGNDPTIANPDKDVGGFNVFGPDWAVPTTVTYKGQIVADYAFTQGGDSGSLVVGDDMQIIGMVAGADVDPQTGFTMMTPFSALLDPSVWGGLNPELITSFDPTYFVPPVDPATGAEPVYGGAASVAVPAKGDSLVATLDDPAKAAISTALRLNEIGDVSPYVLSFAGKGKSGGSFGFTQGDLAAGQPVVRATFLEALATAGVSDAEAQSLKSQLSVHLINNHLSTADYALINAALSSDAGRRLVDAMDQQILGDLFARVNECIAAAVASNRFISLKALLYMAMWINMDGPPTALLQWLVGGEVKFDTGKTVLPPGPLVDGTAMENYLQATNYFSVNSRNFNHLCQCAAEALA